MNFEDLKAGDVMIVRRIDAVTREQPTITTVIRRLEQGAQSQMTYICDQQTSGHTHYITVNDVIKYLPKEKYPEYYL